MSTTLERPARTIPKLSTYRLLQASGALDFRFDDLNLEIEDGFGAGRFDGTATITYWSDAEEGLSWFVGDITLECHPWNGKSFDVRHIEIEQDTKLYTDIWSQLTDGNFKDAVEAKVMEQL